MSDLVENEALRKEIACLQKENETLKSQINTKDTNIDTTSFTTIVPYPNNLAALQSLRAISVDDNDGFTSLGSFGGVYYNESDSPIHLQHLFQTNTNSKRVLLREWEDIAWRTRNGWKGLDYIHNPIGSAVQGEIAREEKCYITIAH